jgi:hypothetical protein
MNGWTIDELCKVLNLKQKTVEGRINRAKIEPQTRKAVYPADTLERIKNIKMGRPKKAPEPAKKPAAKKS